MLNKLGQLKKKLKHREGGKRVSRSNFSEKRRLKALFFLLVANPKSLQFI